MIPDVEAAVVAFLLDQEAVTDLVGENGVSTEIPPGAALPRIRVTLGSGRLPVPGWLYAPRITVEAWADAKGDAFALLATALHALETDLVTAQVEQGVVTSCDMDSGILWAPDPASETPRYLGSVVITIHPHP